jgi:hypothetical protein
MSNARHGGILPRSIQNKSSMDGCNIPSNTLSTRVLDGKEVSEGFGARERWFTKDIAEFSTASLSAGICFPDLSSWRMKS